MTEKRNITKEDILLRGRIQAAGFEVKGPLLFEPIGSMESYGVRVVLDDTDMVVPFLQPAANPGAYTQIAIEGMDVVISEEGKVVATGRLEAQPSWCDVMMRDGTTRVGDAFLTNLPTECYVPLGNNGCFARGTGRCCAYCGFITGPGDGGTELDPREIGRLHERIVEAIALAAKHGWRGSVLIVGGLLRPDLRGQWFTEAVESIMTRFRELLDDEDILSELHIGVDNCPPDDLGEYHKWKTFGINSIEIDTEVLDPAYFKAICPAKDKKRWDEGQEAAAEIFGRGRGSANLFVLGVEPMAGMLEGVEERVSKGVYTMPSAFGAHPDSPMAGMGSPSPEWFREAYEKILDIYLKYADTFDVDLTEDDRWGYTRRTRCLMPYDVMWISRLQEMSKLPPGLPSQYTVEAA